MKLLVTGGREFIDSNFVRYIPKKYSNFQTVNFDKLIYDGNPANWKDSENNINYSFMQRNLCNSIIVNKIMEKIDMLARFAAECYIDCSIEDGLIFARTNVLGTDTLLKGEFANKNLGDKIHVLSN